MYLDSPVRKKFLIEKNQVQKAVNQLRNLRKGNFLGRDLDTKGAVEFGRRSFKIDKIID